jgi:thioredoxin-like negative regulator of GroEL
MKKLLILMLMISTLFSSVRELTDENFEKATTRGLVAVEFYATWNEVNKVTAIDEWDSFDAKVYRLNIDTYPKIQAANEVVILPTIIFFDDGEEVHRLQGDMTFTLKTTTDELDEVVEEILGNKF